MPSLTQALADNDMHSALRSLDAEVQACLALNRATLRALAAMSPLLSSAAETACEDEADQARSPRVVEVLDGLRDRLRRAPAEARMVEALERALADAAEALREPARRTG